jgi:hypothetical protein
MARGSVFTPPPDDDVIDQLTGRAKPLAPPRPELPAPEPVAPRPAPLAASVEPSRPIPVDVPSVKPEPRPRPVATPASRAKALPAGNTKRVGLYLSFEQWARLSEISVERARRGQPDDFTSIAIEALEKLYGKFPGVR